jgi:hypothetical protein
MSKGKIVRLGDPDNPYTKKNTVVASNDTMKPTKTTYPTAKKVPEDKRSKLEKVRDALVSAPGKAMKAAEDFGTKTMKSVNDEYGGGARKRAIDSQVDAAENPPKKKK